MAQVRSSLVLLLCRKARSRMGLHPDIPSACIQRAAVYTSGHAFMDTCLEKLSSNWCMQGMPLSVDGKSKSHNCNHCAKLCCQCPGRHSESRPFVVLSYQSVNGIDLKHGSGQGAGQGKARVRPRHGSGQGMGQGKAWVRARRRSG